LTTLYSFGAANDGGQPEAALVQGSDGFLYGTTSISESGGGTVFRISAEGVLTSLYSFTGRNDGANPNELVQGSDGRFYGTTSSGGLGGAGTVFRLTILPEFQAAILTDNKLSLSWSAESGASYQLQFNSDLSSSNWTNLGDPAIATGSTLILMDSVTNVSQRFYRLALSP
jgi:uncharacterized repeat protein (TIGR03803 family)